MEINRPLAVRRRTTEYGRQLREKQDLKKEYGLRENQFRRYILAARRMPGNAGDNLVRILESRLDNVVYRAGLALTRAQARQYVSHGHFLFNGRRVTIPSILVKLGDRLEARNAGFFQDRGLSLAAPAWLAVDDKKMKIEIKSVPNRAEITDIGQDIAVVLQFYAR